MNEFDEYVQDATGEPLTALSIDKIQVNITLKCNLECVHCHVSSSPRRTEMMSRETMEHIFRAANQVEPEQVDITGGAPEIHPDFTYFVNRLREDGHQIQVRTNLTILLEEGYEDMAPFLREHDVHLIASLPCYLEDNVDQQRGEGVYNESVEAIQMLNDLGYGTPDGPDLDLVYNPVEPHLPPPQEELERQYREKLDEWFGISFDNLYTITNMPIGMFLHQLREQDKLEDYRQLLREEFNPGTLEGLMCRNQINVGWDGTVYDCDFNLALRDPVEEDVPQNIADFDREAYLQRTINTDTHCFGCTAGAGSSCGGTIVEDEEEVVS